MSEHVLARSRRVVAKGLDRTQGRLRVIADPYESHDVRGAELTPARRAVIEAAIRTRVHA